jgi:cyclopropane fatty-acyl-phospholipid synthase-like methyltransferase
MKDTANTVPPEVYTRDYYERHCQGHEEFQQSQGGIIPDRLRIPLALANVTAGMTVLDVGCGRGEILLQGARLGARCSGFDYALPAVQIAVDALKDKPERSQILTHLSNAQYLPYPDRLFDRVFMLDVVEHLYPKELHLVFCEVKRVLSPTGKLIIHTMPNTWYYAAGYPLFRLSQRLRGRHIPSDPRDRWQYKEVHVNEQNPVRLRRALGAAGLRAKVWLQTTQSYVEEPNPYARLVMKMLVTLYPFRWVFCNDLFAVASV